MGLAYPPDGNVVPFRRCQPRSLAEALPALCTTGRSMRAGEVPTRWLVDLEARR
jgi:hypothetical protein